MTRRVTLYRFFNTDNVLLYVGIAYEPFLRWHEHRATRAWWSEVDRATVEWLPSRAEAEAAEVKAIKDERPLYNQTPGVRRPPAKLAPRTGRCMSWTPNRPGVARGWALRLVCVIENGHGGRHRSVTNYEWRHPGDAPTRVLL